MFTTQPDTTRPDTSPRADADAAESHGPASYDITCLEDFLAIPPDRLLPCLMEFAVTVAVWRRMEQDGVRPEGGFTWIDDGQTRMMVPVAGEDGAMGTARFDWRRMIGGAVQRRRHSRHATEDAGAAADLVVPVVEFLSACRA